MICSLQQKNGKGPIIQYVDSDYQPCILYRHEMHCSPNSGCLVNARNFVVDTLPYLYIVKLSSVENDHCQKVFLQYLPQNIEIGTE